MATYDIPKSIYPPHPAGRHTGVIHHVEDKGLVLNKKFNKEEHKIAVFIKTEGIVRDDGEPWFVQQWFTLSNSPKANLRKFREAVLDRPLSAEELAAPFDDAEIVGRRITYRIDHSEPNEVGQVYGNIRDGSVEPASGPGPDPQAFRSQPARPQQGASRPAQQGDDSDLPF
jgi:hypothetical protein